MALTLSQARGAPGKYRRSWQACTWTSSVPEIMSFTGTPQPPFKRPRRPSNRDHKALNSPGLPQIYLLKSPEIPSNEDRTGLNRGRLCQERSFGKDALRRVMRPTLATKRVPQIDAFVPARGLELLTSLAAHFANTCHLFGKSVVACQNALANIWEVCKSVCISPGGKFCVRESANSELDKTLDVWRRSANPHTCCFDEHLHACF